MVEKIYIKNKKGALRWSISDEEVEKQELSFIAGGNPK